MKKILILAALFALSSCSQGRYLVILHTNDTHSHFEPVKTGKYAGSGGCIERAAFVDSVRTAEGADKVLLLHAGDFSQGTSYFTELKGSLEPQVINAMGYDVITLGNHEFDNDVEALTQRIKAIDRSRTQVVCANLDLSQFELGKLITPYAIVNRNGLKIGVIGLEANLRGKLVRTVADRIQQLDDVEVTNRWALKLRKEEKCDLVILLTHIGYKEDQKLVPLIRNVDLVVGGHSHTFVDDLLYVKDASGKKVPIVTDGQWGLEMGKITIKK